MAILTKTVEIKDWYRWYLQHRPYSDFSMYITEQEDGSAEVTMMAYEATLKEYWSSYEVAVQLFSRAQKRVGFPLGLYPNKRGQDA